MKKIENKAMKDQVSKLDKDLAKAKIDLKDSKLNDRFFQVERIKDGIVKNKKVMTVIFRLIKGSKTEKGRCECVFKRQKHGGTSKEDVVNLLDFNTFKINDKKKDYFDVSFMADGEEQKYQLIVNELIQEHLLKAYKDFLEKAKEIM